MENNHKYFKNADCQYFPCHKTAEENFNCIFCYCPLYVLGDKCGGNFTYTDEGVKDCSNCLVPHSECGYEYVTSRLSDVSEMKKEE